jgi:hypothetical protein
MWLSVAGPTRHLAFLSSTFSRSLVTATPYGRGFGPPFFILRAGIGFAEMTNWRGHLSADRFGNCWVKLKSLTCFLGRRSPTATPTDRNQTAQIAIDRRMSVAPAA